MVEFFTSHPEYISFILGFGSCMLLFTFGEYLHRLIFQRHFDSAVNHLDSSVEELNLNLHYLNDLVEELDDED